MPAVGPQLPPELQSRKRSLADAPDDDEDDHQSTSSDSSTGPAPLDPASKNGPNASAKRARVIGPSLPPTALNESEAPAPKLTPPQLHHAESADEDQDEDDDDFGPKLPSAADPPAPLSLPSAQGAVAPNRPGPAKRDEWMTLEPTSGDWSARVDPTKLKNRKFNTGRGAKAASHGGGSAAGGGSWHETPEEKQARQRREVLGIEDNSTPRHAETSDGQGLDGRTAKRLKEYNDRQRGPSLYATHNSANGPKPEEDDPSARAFDREKDIAGGATINATKRTEMVRKAADFSSRFSTAKYL